jgi:hypothetical protein
MAALLWQSFGRDPLVSRCHDEMTHTLLRCMRMTRVRILCVVCAVPQEVRGVRAMPGHVPVCQGAHGGQGGYRGAHLAFGCVHLRLSLTVSMRDNIACDVLSGICFRAVRTIGVSTCLILFCRCRCPSLLPIQRRAFFTPRHPASRVDSHVSSSP